MKFYREVLIESAEQAEALPEGTIAVMPERDASGPAVIAVKAYDNEWWGTSCCEMTNAKMVGSKALVPIEVEVEYSTEESERRWSFDGLYDAPENVRRDGWEGTMRRRFLTDWEEA